MQRPLGAQISHMLKDRGVDVIFGIPGVHNQEMYRGIEEAGITHVLARHEQGAGFMADGYARATGKPGVAYVITGPGLTNIMTPMGQAYSDSVPMLVISSCLDETAAKYGQLHQMKDQRAAAETVCDWSFEAGTADAAYTLIDRAFSEFRTERQRPKHIQVPIAALEAPAAPARPRHWAPATLPRVNTDQLHEVKTHLERARAPMIIVGGGHKGGGSMVVEVADNTGAALFTTYAGRGLVPDDHPRLFGAMLARPDSAEILRRADLLIIVGSEMSQGDLWRDDPGFDGTVMRIDIDAQSLTDSMGAEYIYKYDAGLFMAGLAHATRDCTPAVKWRPAEVAATRARWREQVLAERPGIVEVADAARAATPKDAMIYSDMTQFAYAAKEIWPMAHPHHWHHPTGFGTLGYALPAAIGGAVARPGQPTMAIIGDYGFHYTMAELGVAVELNLPLPIILWDNGKLKEIEDSMTRAQIAPNAVVARNPDFCKLAKAFGAHAAAPQSLNDMQNAVRTAFDANGPTLIYVTPDITSSSD
ncbi:MAG: 5-guanidino-2-oxopentanoate decarboxylase [Pseudomonadota bacterium]